MGQGLRVWDASGHLIFDTSTRLGLVIGHIDTGTSAGYVDDDRFGGGVPFWTCYVLNNSGNITQPNIVVSWTGSTWRLSWSFPAGSTPTNNRIIYGVY